MWGHGIGTGRIEVFLCVGNPRSSCVVGKLSRFWGQQGVHIVHILHGLYRLTWVYLCEAHGLRHILRLIRVAF